MEKIDSGRLQKSNADLFNCVLSEVAKQNLQYIDTGQTSSKPTFHESLSKDQSNGLQEGQECMKKI